MRQRPEVKRTKQNKERQKSTLRKRGVFCYNKNMTKPYIEHEGKVLEKNNQFKHVMAMTINPLNHREGVVRCITSRSGDLAFRSNIDKSELHKIVGDFPDHFEIGDKLNIKNEKEIIDKLVGQSGDFIGLEDPDIWIDEKTNLMHLYFTIPIVATDQDHHQKNGHTRVNLGHAFGKDLENLMMTDPVLVDNGKFMAKEVSIA